MLLELEFRQPAEADAWLISITGELDFHSAPRFRRTFQQAAPPAGSALVLDLTDLGLLDSSGLGAIVELLKHTEACGAQLRVVSAHERINRVFDVTRLRDILGVVATREQAFAEIAQTC